MPSGILAKLVLELGHLSTLNEVTIVCLRKGTDALETKKAYPNASFFNIDTVFSGWEIANLQKVVKAVSFYRDFKVG